MNPELLLDYFDSISEAPGAIPRLRQFILDLAARGRLVDQDPRDEPASELLRRIQAEKARLVEKGEIRKQETLPLNKDEEPFAIPVSWVWTRLGQIGDWGSGSTPSRGNHDLFGGGITWLKSGELNDDKQLAHSEETVTEVAISKGSFRRNQAGDVLIAMYGATIGKVAILAEDAVTNQAVCGCSPFPGVSNLYLFNFLLSQRSEFHAASEGGAQPNISKIKILGFAFPLPPLAEQHRIVAKVDELMALCDHLGATRDERETRRNRVVTASHHYVSNTADPEAFHKHARFYINHLRSLTISAEHVQQFRKTILNLAVRGRLVPQSSNDEPLKLIRLLGKERRFKHELVRIEPDEIPFSAPPGWEFARIGTFCELENGDRSKNYPSRHEFVANGIPFINAGHLQSGGICLTEMNYIPESRFDLLKSGKVKNGDILFCLRGSLGKSALVSNISRGAIASSLVIIRLADEVNPHFMLKYLFSSLAVEMINRFDNGTAQPNLSSADLRKFICPLPPLAEQHRIVAKVDELMTLCDRLETQLTTAQAEASRLLEAVLHQSLAEAS
jgi:type I restriction enzyme, S subunit